jgi:hypothetical protein
MRSSRLKFAILALAAAVMTGAAPSFAEDKADPEEPALTKPAPEKNTDAAATDEEPAVLLKPRPPGKQSPVLLKPKHNQDVKSPDSEEPPRLGWGISALLTTPLIKENTFDARFKAYGAMALVTFPLTHIHHRLYLHAEGGFGATLARFEPTSSPGFNHIHFDFPIRLRLLYPLDDSGLSGEIFAGAVLRFFQYNDDVGLANGPFFSVNSEVFQPDFAVGLAVPLSRSLRARLLAGYIYLSLGLELTFDKSP